MTEEENKLHNKFLDNPMFQSFIWFLKKYGQIGSIVVKEGRSEYIGSVRYGKAKVYFNAFVDDHGAISDLVFDLREVYEVYKGENVKTGRLAFINDIDIHEYLEHYSNDKYYCIKEFKSGLKGEDEPFFAVGISLVGYKNDKFNKYTPWAGAIYEVLEALDKAHGFEGKDKKNRIKRETVDKTATTYAPFYWMIMSLFYLVGFAGIALIVLGIMHKVHPAVGWIFGIICILVYLFFGLSMTLHPIRYKKEYYSNSGDLEKKFFEADHSVFG